MRIVVDMQAVQTGSRFRGIGRYARELVKALARQPGNHEVVLALNGRFSNTIEAVRADFQDVIAQRNIRVWHSPGPVSFVHDNKAGLRKASEAIREHFLLAQKPDVILIPSIFEGLSDDTVLSIGAAEPRVPVVSICHDLIPLVDPAPSFKTDRITRAWYRDRLATLRESDLVLTNSDYSRNEAIEVLAIPPEHVVTIGAGHDAAFRNKNLSDDQQDELKQRLGIIKPFLMFAGSLEASKNVAAFLTAMGQLPSSLQNGYDIVVVGKREPDDVARLLALAPNNTIRSALRVVGHVTDEMLVDLYNCCAAFVFPSKREGFGLPPLEAMACGAPVIASNSTSLPEVIGDEEGLFDPNSIDDIAQKIEQVLTDAAFRARRIQNGLKRAAELDWDKCAEATLKALARFQPIRNAKTFSQAKVFRIESITGRKKRILVSKLDHAGDFILALPAISKIRARYPDAQIDALVGNWNRVAAEYCNIFDNIHTLDYFKSKSSLQAAVNEREIGDLVNSLPYYDYAIDLRRHSDTRFILLALRAGKYFGYRTGNPKYDENLTRPLDIHPELAGERDFFDEMHISEQMLRIVDTLPAATGDYVRIPSFSNAQVEPGTVGIFPRVGSDARQWDSERFVELVAQLCADKEISEVNIFGVNQAELDEVGFLQDKKIHFHSGLPFDKLTAELGRNTVCVGNNSFGVHLGSLLGCKTVAIYSGHEMPEQWAPAFGSVDVVTANVECSPCHLPTKDACPFEMRCLTSIDVSTVFEAIKAKLGTDGFAPAISTEGWLQSDYAEQTVRSLNRLKFRGELDGLNDDDRKMLEAALLVNFPAGSIRRKNRIYFDLSAYIPGNINTDFQPNADRDVTIEIADLLVPLLPDYEVAFIASGPHDHEFYETSLEDLDGFFAGRRVSRIVYPAPGDIYVSLSRLPNKNAALWDLLQTWREQGVRVSFSVKNEDLIEAGRYYAATEISDQQFEIGAYLTYVSKFDVIVVADPDAQAAMQAFIWNHAPARERPIEIVVNPTITLLSKESLGMNAIPAGPVDQDKPWPAITDLARSLSQESADARLAVRPRTLFQ